MIRSLSMSLSSGDMDSRSPNQESKPTVAVAVAAPSTESKRMATKYVSKRLTTKEHLTEKANIAKYKKKKAAETEKDYPWFVGKRYVFSIPEDNFEVSLAML
jgi:hypothetical protein